MSASHDHHAASGHDGGVMEHGEHMGHRDVTSDQHAHHAGHTTQPHRPGHAGHGDHVARYRRLFWLMLALAVPVVSTSETFAHLVGYTVPDVPWVAWVSPVLGTVIYAWGGWPFLTGAVAEIRSRKPGMMLLIGLGITVAFAASWGASAGLLDPDLNFWWELALLVVIMLLGHWIEMRSLARTTSALDSLAALIPDQAEKVIGDTITTVTPADLVVGDVVVVRPGAAVPADGVVIDGAASMNESMITGESTAVRRSIGDRVVTGTVATDSGLRVRVTATGDNTALAGIQRLVADAQASSSRAQRIADRAAGWLFWFAVGVALIAAIVWTALGLPDAAVVRAITVLVIACPHALGLAIPLVVSIATERAARGGVLVKDRLALEAMRTVDTVLFDKTGTLTKGEPTVTGVSTGSTTEVSTGSTTEASTGSTTEASTSSTTEASTSSTSGVAAGSPDEVLALAAAAETGSEHPLAKAIVQAATTRGLAVPSAQDFSSSPAVGVKANVAGRIVEVGGPPLLAQHGLNPLPVASDWNAEGATVLHVVTDGQIIGALRLADDVRPESRTTVDALHAAGIQVVMITGDAQSVADTVATAVGIDRVFAQVRPEDKAATVRHLQSEGHRVAMVGDGVNDAPALAQADVGIAIGAGTDVAIGSAGVILASSDPRSVLSVITLSRASYQKMKQNLWWAAGYNLVSVPLAAGVLAPIGFTLPMSVGALLMSTSTIVVALNAQLLRRLDLRPEANLSISGGRQA